MNTVIYRRMAARKGGASRTISSCNMQQNLYNELASLMVDALDRGEYTKVVEQTITITTTIDDTTGAIQHTTNISDWYTVARKRK